MRWNVERGWAALQVFVDAQIAKQLSCSYDDTVRITFDPAKRAATLQERGLDFADARTVFIGKEATLNDERFDYGEIRRITAGFLNGRMVIVVWTPRGEARHIISMRHAHAKEQRRWAKHLG